MSENENAAGFQFRECLIQCFREYLIDPVDSSILALVAHFSHTGQTSVSAYFDRYWTTSKREIHSNVTQYY